MTPYRRPLYLTSEDRQRDRWVFSYTDTVTILMILFVWLAAQTFHSLKTHPVPAPPVAKAAVQPQPQAQPQPQPQPSPQVQPPAQPQPQPRSTLLQVQDTLRKHGIDQRMELRGLVITLPQAILFHSGDDRISPSALPIIEQIADAIRDTDFNVQLIGHADAVPIHNRRFQNNWALSAARSLQLLHVLTNQYGVAESRLSVISRGSQDPLESNQTQDGRAENRRVEIVIVDEQKAPVTRAAVTVPPVPQP